MVMNDLSRRLLTISIRAISSWRWRKAIGILTLGMRVDSCHIGRGRILRRRVIGAILIGRRRIRARWRILERRQMEVSMLDI